MNWFEKAACKGMDVNLFFPERGKPVPDIVRETCAGCPVQQECLKYGLSQSLQIGIFGGMSGRQRDTILYGYDKRTERKAV